MHALRDGFEFRLGDGNSSLWFSKWLDVGRLADHVIYVDIHDLNMRVKDVYTNGHWNFNLMYTNIPPAICDRLHATPICLNPMVADRITWKGNLDGIYTAKAGYSWLNKIDFARGMRNQSLGTGVEIACT